MEKTDGVDEAVDASIMASEQLRYLLKNTGLNIHQVSRLFNKSASEIGVWTFKKYVPENQRERMQSVYERIKPLGYSPESTRRLLLKSSHGRSIFHMLVDEVRDTSPVIQVRAISVRDSLGV